MATPILTPDQLVDVVYVPRYITKEKLEEYRRDGYVDLIWTGVKLQNFMYACRGTSDPSTLANERPYFFASPTPHKELLKFLLSKVKPSSERGAAMNRTADSPYAMSAADDFIVQCTLEAMDRVRNDPTFGDTSDAESVVIETVNAALSGKPVEFLNTLAKALHVTSRDLDAYKKDAVEMLQDAYRGSKERPDPNEIYMWALDLAIGDRIIPEVQRRVTEEIAAPAPLELSASADPEDLVEVAYRLPGRNLTVGPWKRKIVKEKDLERFIDSLEKRGVDLSRDVEIRPAY